MIVHYLKIAFRNMWKYKSQTLISVLGLAVGFTCFALATLWIRYEMTYDSFHKNAKQMYVVYRLDFRNQTNYSRSTVYPLAAYLKETFPEITNAIPLGPSLPNGTVTVEGIEYPALTIRADSSFFRLFDVKLLEGNREFLIPGSNTCAITLEKARQLFKDEHPIGKTVNILNNEYAICAIVSEMSKRSNYAYDIIISFSINTVQEEIRLFGSENTIIELYPETNIEAFEKKIYEHVIDGDRTVIRNMIIKPLTKLRYIDAEISRDIKFEHILIFVLSGLLVVLCSLFNYLTLFLNRFRIRQKEMALRVVCGASESSLLAMLLVEFILTLFFAVLLGCVLTHLSYETFTTLSDISMDLFAIFRESLMYIGGVILVSLFVFWVILFIFRHRSLNLSIHRSNRKMFRKISVVVQLVIGIGFAFCTVVILKQMYFLHHSGELGFSFQNRVAVDRIPDGYSEVLATQLKQIPEITEVVYASTPNLILPLEARMSTSADSWDDKPVEAETIDFERMFVSPEYCVFYDFQLVTGEMLTDDDPDSLVLINESAAKTFGWYEPVGKHFGNSFSNYTIKGVIKNVYNFAPTVPAKPMLYQYMQIDGSGIVLFKYHEGMWVSCKEKIDQLIQKEYPNHSMRFTNTEEEYNKFLTSENALIKLLSFVSAICVLICVFGFVSLVSLTCEERRKSIAIRKINGATAGDILGMFAKEYSLLLIIGAVVAFPAGFVIMQRWLEHYVKQTNIPVWIYLSILFVMALVNVLCVGCQVYKTSIGNPAEVVKKE